VRKGRSVLRPIGLVALALTGVLTSGCAVGYNEALEMRNEQDPVKLADDELRLNDFLEHETGKLPRRCAVMETAVIIAKQQGYKASSAAVYNATVGLLESEARNPRVDEGSDHAAEDGAFERAWAVHCLGRLEDPDLVEFLVKVAVDADLSATTSCRTQIAALDALVPLVETVKKSAPDRNRLLAGIPVIRVKFPREKVAVGFAEERDRLLNFFVVALKTLENVNSLLEQPDTSKMSEPAWLETLTWDYQLVNEYVSKQSKAADPRSYEANLHHLLAVAHHPEPAVRKAARTVLMTAWPATLFERLIAKAKEDPRSAKEDLELLVGLLPSLDASARSYNAAPPAPDAIYYCSAGATTPTLNEVAVLSSDRFTRLKDDLSGALFTFTATASAADREFLYASIFEYDPCLLANQLVSVESRALVEKQPERVQHVRYLGNLLASQRVAADAALLEAVAVSLSHMVWVDDAAQQRQVASYMLEDRTECLAAACHLPIHAIASLSHLGANGILDLYFEALVRLEKRKDFAGFAASRYFKSQQGAPYAVLAAVFSRTEWDLRSKVVAFMLPRNPPALVGLLAGAIGKRPKPHSRDVEALGDVLMKRRADLPESSLKIGIDALAAGLPAADEDTALLIVRYLAELKHDAASESLDVYRRSGKCTFESVRTVVESALAPGQGK
jgi:hypothetical protein